MREDVFPGSARNWSKFVIYTKVKLVILNANEQKVCSYYAITNIESISHQD
jgi:hypothetical protein